MRIHERNAAEGERGDARTQLRAQLANHATGLFVVLNAGGLAAALTWLQSLPIDAATYSCNGVLLRTVPWAAGLLIGGVIATAVSYLIRYQAPDPGRIQRGWMIALAVSAATLIGAGVLVSYTVLNCRTIAIEQERRSNVDFEFQMARLQGRSEDEVIADSLRGSEEALRRLDYAIAEAAYRERVELEQKIQRLQELRFETTRRIGQLKPDQVSKKLVEELDRINRLDKELRAELNE